jgi:glyoxylase-like metal-dependent hydrolase (beta-lactamase superfamily II)
MLRRPSRFPNISLWLPLVLATLLAACDVNKVMTSEALGQQIDYVNAPGAAQGRLERVASGVWTYHWYFDRTLIIDTAEGLVVVDSFSPELATHLIAALRAAGVTKPVHTLIYTHYHMDHTRGGAALAPRNVICHVRCAHWWGRFPEADTAGVLRPTQTIDADTTLRIGGVEIRLLYLEHAHTDTNFAVQLPAQGVLYAADTVAIRALLPSGGVSIFMPDYLSALDRLEREEFDIFVSSHFAWGTKADFRAAVQMQRDSWTWIKESVGKAGAPREDDLPLINDRERVQRAYEWYYDRMKEKYGGWHGFEAQILPTFLNGLIAHYVGS